MRAVWCWPLVAVVFALGCKEDAAKKQAEQDKKATEEAAAQAEKDAKEATAQLDRVDKALKDLDGKIAEAITAVADAANDADRASAKARLVALQREQAEVKERVARARAAADSAERLRVKLSKECVDNPQAKGCS